MPSRMPWLATCLPILRHTMILRLPGHHSEMQSTTLLSLCLVTPQRSIRTGSTITTRRFWAFWQRREQLTQRDSVTTIALQSTTASRKWGPKLSLRQDRWKMPGGRLKQRTFRDTLTNTPPGCSSRASEPSTDHPPVPWHLSEHQVPHFRRRNPTSWSDGQHTSTSFRTGPPVSKTRQLRICLSVPWFTPSVARQQNQRPSRLSGSCRLARPLAQMEYHPKSSRLGGEVFTEQLVSLFQLFWERGDVPREPKDANIVHLQRQRHHTPQHCWLAPAPHPPEQNHQTPWQSCLWKSVWVQAQQRNSGHDICRPPATREMPGAAPRPVPLVHRPD